MQVVRRNGVLPVLAAVLAGLGLSVAAERAPQQVFTLLDYFEHGQRAVTDYVRACDRAGSAPRLAEAIRQAKPACVRIEMRDAGHGGSFASVIASGVVVDAGRRLLTAGHSFEGATDALVVVTLPTGDTRPARLVEHRYRPERDEDWAVLELLGAAAPSVAQGDHRRVRKGDLVFVLGYPDRIGVDAAGRVAYCPGSGRVYREPLTLMAEVDSVRPLRLIPRAGSIPIGGMSGGPVFDASGRLIGIFASVSRIEVEGEVSHAYNGSLLPALPPAITRGAAR